MRTSLVIEEKDIEQGIRGSRCECPVARAARRKFPRDAKIFVDHSQLTVYHDGGRREVYHLPDETHQFISDFDRGVPLLPRVLQMEFGYSY
jgi:hypothetical protein